MKKEIWIVGVAAAFCFSGQVAREENRQVPMTKIESAVVEVEEVKKEELVVAKEDLEPKRKSAAKRSMEAQQVSAAPAKSAAKRAIEEEMQR